MGKYCTASTYLVAEGVDGRHRLGIGVDDGTGRAGDAQLLGEAPDLPLQGVAGRAERRHLCIQRLCGQWSTQVNDGQQWSTQVNDGQRWF